MKKLIWSAICFIWLCVSCTGGYPTSSRLSHTSPEPVREEEREADTNCSYFYYLWGKSAELSGLERYDEAVEAYEKALVCDAGATYVMLDLTVLLVRMGKKQHAVSLMNKIIHQDPKDINNRIMLANLHISMGQIDQAVSTYNSILESDPDNISIILRLGSLYARERRYGKAQEVLERLVALDKESYIGYHYLARLYQELRFNRKALKAYKKALSLNWSLMMAFEAADLYDELEQYEDAVGLYRDILERDETNEKARARLAGIYLRMDNVAAALAELEELRNYALETQEVDYTIGRILFENDRFDEAIEHLDRVLAESPDLTSARILKALAYHEKEDNERAREELSKVEPSSKGYEEAVLMLARLFVDEEEYEAVEKVLLDAIALTESRKAEFYMALASFYRERDRIPDAKKIYKECLLTYPNDHKVLFRYGMFLERTGDMDAAMKTIKEVLRIKPNYPYALNYVGYTWADAGINLEQALEHVEQAVALLPEDGFVRDSLGWVYYKMGDFKRAVFELEIAVELEPDDPTILEHLGDAYLGLQQVERARDAYEMSLDLYEDEEDREGVRKKIRAMHK